MSRAAPAIELVERHEDLPPLRRPALRHAQERAALSASLVREAAAARRRSRRSTTCRSRCRRASTYRRHRPQRIGQEHGAQARRRHHEADERRRDACDGRISALIELGAGFHPGDLRPRERLHQRRSCSACRSARFRSASTRSSSSPSCASSSTRRSRRTRPACTCGSASRSRSTSIPDVLLVDEVLAVGDEGFTHKCLDKFARVQAAQQDDPARHALARPRRALLRRGALARRGREARARAIRSASSART